MAREEILAEIRRTAEENGGVPLGRNRFENATGIREHELWKYWPRFGDAVREAGFEPNALNVAYSDEYLMSKIIALVRELGKFPTRPEMAVKRNSDREFPNEGVFRRFGAKSEFAAAVLQYCDGRPEYADVAGICEAVAISRSSGSLRGVSEPVDVRFGFVYLIKGHPGEYKIGHTNLVDRRVSELGATFPVEQQPVHTIKTDDPAGVEAYWHKRFENKRMKGEWFRLKPDDVKAFKRWKRIL